MFALASRHYADHGSMRVYDYMDVVKCLADTALESTLSSLAFKFLTSLSISQTY